MYAKYPHPEPIEKAVKLVMSQPKPMLDKAHYYVAGLESRSPTHQNGSAAAANGASGRTSGYGNH
ncbi:hypothetical protein CVT25_003275 [Psilocybe cyanescens]|uniref:Uncharacterized protein n=1 Tax=Psilocybe cyanescens TaxID=93625 RepID=A0A409WMM1_PSICY|nr:hypothetical protein CVT25_003275 [Psilocybe cyanescens]